MACALNTAALIWFSAPEVRYIESSNGVKLVADGLRLPASALATVRLGIRFIRQWVP
jgi:hypothetical protein